MSKKTHYGSEHELWKVCGCEYGHRVPATEFGAQVERDPNCTSQGEKTRKEGESVVS
jgi:hypothetical protein